MEPLSLFLRGGSSCLGRHPHRTPSRVLLWEGGPCGGRHRHPTRTSGWHPPPLGRSGPRRGPRVALFTAPTPTPAPVALGQAESKSGGQRASEAQGCYRRPSLPVWPSHSPVGRAVALGLLGTLCFPLGALGRERGSLGPFALFGRFRCSENQQPPVKPLRFGTRQEHSGEGICQTLG